MTMYVDYPYRFASDGRTATTTLSDHVRDLIEQLLFTRPGERVMRPRFGCGLDRLLFAPAGPELAEQSKVIVLGALQEWLGDILNPTAVDVTMDDGRLTVTVAYTITATFEAREDVFVREVAA